MDNLNNFDSNISYADYEQKGYLNEDFKFFHIKNQEKIHIPFHYHDFHKLILVLNGSIKYLIEGREYELLPFDFADGFYQFRGSTGIGSNAQAEVIFCEQVIPCNV